MGNYGRWSRQIVLFSALSIGLFATLGIAVAWRRGADSTVPAQTRQGQSAVGEQVHGARATVELLETGEARWVLPNDSTIKLQPGVGLHRRFAVVNHTGAPISKLTVSSSCSCAKATIGATELAAGESTVADFVIDTKGQGTNFSLAFRLECRVADRIAVFGVPNFFVTEPAVSGNEFSWNDLRDIVVDTKWKPEWKSAVAAEFRLGSEWRLSDIVVETSSKYVEASMAKDVPVNGTRRLEVLMRDLPPGPVDEWVALRMKWGGDGNELILKKTIAGAVVPPFSVDPMYLHAGTSITGERNEYQILVNRRTGQNLSPNCEVHGDWVLVGISDNADGVVVTVRPNASSKPGLLRGELVVKAQDSIVAKVPLRLMIADQSGQN